MQPLPAVFAERFGSVTPGARGGVSVPRDQWQAPLDAAWRPRVTAPLRQARASAAEKNHPGY